VVLSGEKAYVIAEEMNLLAAFNITGEGGLSLDWEGTRLQNGNGTGADIQVTPSGKYLYATNRDPDNSIVAYDISGSAPVLLEHESTLGDTPGNFAIDPAEELVIVANHGNSKSLAIFSIQADGSLEPEAPLSTSFSPSFVGIVQF
jgi:6-phosphogluconolactonase